MAVAVEVSDRRRRSVVMAVAVEVPRRGRVRTVIVAVAGGMDRRLRGDASGEPTVGVVVPLTCQDGGHLAEPPGAAMAAERPVLLVHECLQAGTTFGVVFVHWLMFQSLYRIDALCPYCMVVWAVTIPVFWYTTLHNVTVGHFRLTPRIRAVVARAQAYHGVILTGWFLVIAALVTQRFWDYWSTLLT